MRKNQLFSFVLVILLCTNLSSQSSKTITEDEVPLHLLTNHYDNYPMSETAFWIHEEENDRYLVNFKLNDFQYEVLYFSKGTLLEEKIQVDLLELNPAAYSLISIWHKKFKVLSLYQVKRRKAKEFELMYYEVKCKTKEGEISLFLDPNMETIYDTRFAFLD